LKKHIVRIGLGLVLLLAFLGHAAKYYRLPLVERLEAIVYDTRLALTMPRTVDPRIVILDIDEKSLVEKEKGGEGRWPWPRDRLALLVDKLFDHYKIAIVGFDIVFAERDESSGLKVLQQLAQKELKDVAGFQSTLKQLQPQLEYDELFAAHMRGRPVVLGYAFTRFEGESGKKGALPAPVLPQGTFAGKIINFASFPSYTSNLAELQKNAASAGHFSLDPDSDGILRRVPMLAEFDGAYYEPLSLAIVRLILGGQKIVPGYPTDKIWSRNYSGLEWLEVGPLRIPVDENVTALIPYRGKHNSFNYISAVDVLNERVDPAQLQDKIVLVGTSAPGLLDLRATPIEEVYPGVEVHANMISGMLDRNIKQKPPYVIGAEFVSLLVAGLAMALLLPLLNPFKSLLVTLAVLVIVLFTNLMVFHVGNLVLPLASGLMMILLLFALNMSYGYFVEARGKNQITGLFGQYVPPELVDEMARNPEQFSMAPRAENLTVLFSDVRGFTTISESLSPEDLAIYINDYLTTMSLVIREGHRGTLDKYIGDAIMAFWGAPVGDKDHAKNALLAAMDMQKAAKTLNEKFKGKNWPTFKIGVGVNSGVMRVGDMGSKIRRAYTVMGDAVNLGSRLEGITKEYGADIIVGEGTKDAVPDVVFRELDRVRVKGKDEAVAIFEPFGMQGKVDKARLEEIKLYTQFLRLYRAQDWDQAELQLFNLQKQVPGSPLYSQTFVERISYLRANPPGKGWDGAFTFKTK
jgi:adenylate cyclase